MKPEFLKKCNSEIIADNGKPLLIRVEFLTFPEWPAKIKYSYAAKLEDDTDAILALELLGVTDKDEQVEHYAYCKHGGFDLKPDIDEKGMHTQEYFDCPKRENCPAKAQRHLCGVIKAINGYLFPTEIEIIKLIKAGYADKEIAEMRNVSYNTATKHRANILKKIEGRGKPDIVAFAFNNGI